MPHQPENDAILITDVSMMTRRPRPLSAIIQGRTVIEILLRACDIKTSTGFVTSVYRKNRFVG